MFLKNSESSMGKRRKCALYSSSVSLPVQVTESNQIIFIQYINRYKFKSNSNNINICIYIFIVQKYFYITGTNVYIQYSECACVAA